MSRFSRSVVWAVWTGNAALEGLHSDTARKYLVEQQRQIPSLVSLGLEN